MMKNKWTPNILIHFSLYHQSKFLFLFISISIK
jgi:hypothetical protein